MGWDQEYIVPTVEELLEKLARISGKQLLIDFLEGKGIKIVNIEDIKLDDTGNNGARVVLSDGRVFVPKLVEKFTENGNHGIDTYKWFLEGDTPEVQYVGADTSDPNIDIFDIPEGYGEEDWNDDTHEDDTHECSCGDEFCSTEDNMYGGVDNSVFNDSENSGC